MMDDAADFVMDVLLPLLFAAVVLGGVFILSAIAFDGVQSVRAEPASIACRAKGLNSARRNFTTQVTCVPRPGHGVDSLIVKVTQ